MKPKFLHMNFIYLVLSSLEMQRRLIESNSLVVKLLDSQSRFPCSKPLGGSKVDPAFHLSEVNKMGTRNFWELSSKK